MYLKAGELGCSDAYGALADSYNVANTGEDDVLNKERYYLELAAMRDCIPARNNLGVLHSEAGDRERAYKHFVISAKAGFNDSFNVIKHDYENGLITIDQYSEVLRAYQKKKEDMRSEMRDEYLVYKANPRLYWEGL